MGSFCKWVVRVYATLWAVAVILLAIGTNGLFGQEQDPLAGVFLIPLGFPWVLWTDGLGEGVRPIAAVAAPLLNIAILSLVCRTLRKP